MKFQNKLRFNCRDDFSERFHIQNSEIRGTMQLFVNGTCSINSTGAIKNSKSIG